MRRLMVVALAFAVLAPLITIQAEADAPVTPGKRATVVTGPKFSPHMEPIPYVDGTGAVHDWVAILGAVDAQQLAAYLASLPKPHATPPPPRKEAAVVVDERVGSDEIVAIIVAAAVEFGVDPDLMLAIARCESGFDPTIKNRRSSASGLFQHLATLWPPRADAIGMPGASVFDPVANARAAANMIATGGTDPWNSSRSCWR